MVLTRFLPGALLLVCSGNAFVYREQHAMTAARSAPPPAAIVGRRIALAAPSLLLGVAAATAASPTSTTPIDGAAAGGGEPIVTHVVELRVRVARSDGSFERRDGEPPADSADDVFFGALRIGLFGAAAPQAVARFLEAIMMHGLAWSRLLSPHCGLCGLNHSTSATVIDAPDEHATRRPAPRLLAITALDAPSTVVAAAAAATAAIPMVVWLLEFCACDSRDAAGGGPERACLDSSLFVRNDGATLLGGRINNVEEVRFPPLEFGPAGQFEQW